MQKTQKTSPRTEDRSRDTLLAEPICTRRSSIPLLPPGSTYLCLRVCLCVRVCVCVCVYSHCSPRGSSARSVGEIRSCLLTCSTLTFRFHFAMAAASSAITGASEPGGSLTFKQATFNFGIDQPMLEGKQFRIRTPPCGYPKVDTESAAPSLYDGHQLKKDDSIEVYSRTLKGWVAAIVVDFPRPHHVKVTFQGEDSAYLKDVHIENVSLPQDCFRVVWPLEPVPWGFAGAAYKKSIDALTRVKGQDYFSYWNARAQQRVLPILLDVASGRSHRQIWTSKPYARNGKSTCTSAVSYEALLDMNFGVKQNGPFCYESAHSKLPFFSFKPCLEAEALSVSHQSSLADNSLHGMAKMDCCVNANGLRKLGKGPKFHKMGANACLNSIVTSYDRDGNVRMMAMVRPKKADSDGGDYQMSAGCIFFSEERCFNGIVIPAMSPTPWFVTHGPENCDETGQLKGKGLAYARAAIYEKLWYGRKEFEDILDTWSFHKIGEGIVDDASNTSQAWVETSYNVHHITGDEEYLPLLEGSLVNAKRKNTGDGVWRCIDKNPAAQPVWSQFAEEDADGVFSKRWVQHEPAWFYDPHVEFEFWHGDHSFVASMICDYVKMHYAYTGPVLSSSSMFGRSAPKAVVHEPGTKGCIATSHV